MQVLSIYPCASIGVNTYVIQNIETPGMLINMTFF